MYQGLYACACICVGAWRAATERTENSCRGGSLCIWRQTLFESKGLIITNQEFQWMLNDERRWRRRAQRERGEHFAGFCT